MTKRLDLTVAVVCLLAVSCSGGEDADSGSPTDPPVTPALDGGVAGGEATPDGGGVDAALGTWDDPLPAGTPVSIEGWDITVTGSDVMTEGPDPDMPDAHAPKPGTVHVVVSVDATRTGDQPARIPTMGEGFTLSLANGGTEVGENVAITINDPIANGDVGPGSTVEGWMLASAHVPTDSVEGSVVVIKPFVANPETYYVAMP